MLQVCTWRKEGAGDLSGYMKRYATLARRFRVVYSTQRKPSVKTVLPGPLEGKRTLSGDMNTVGQPPGVRGLSHCLSEAAWIQHV